MPRQTAYSLSELIKMVSSVKGNSGKYCGEELPLCLLINEIGESAASDDSEEVREEARNFLLKILSYPPDLRFIAFSFLIGITLKSGLSSEQFLILENHAEMPINSELVLKLFLG